MSIQSEVERISTNVQNTLEAIRQTGVSVPENATCDALPAAAASLANEKQDKLTGSQGQVVGFDAEGNAVATLIPDLSGTYVPVGTTINGKPLSANVQLTAGDVGAIPATEKGAASGVATLDSNGKIPGGNLDLSGYVPASRKINGKALTNDISLTASDVGAATTGYVDSAIGGAISASY